MRQTQAACPHFWYVEVVWVMNDVLTLQHRKKDWVHLIMSHRQCRYKVSFVWSCALFVRAPCWKCLSPMPLCAESQIHQFLITAAVVFSRSGTIWGGRHADTFVSSYPPHTDWSIYLPSGAENAVSVNDSIFGPAGWEPASCNMRNVSALWEWHVVTPNGEGGGEMWML